MCKNPWIEHFLWIGDSYYKIVGLKNWKFTIYTLAQNANFGQIVGAFLKDLSPTSKFRFRSLPHNIRSLISRPICHHPPPPSGGDGHHQSATKWVLFLWRRRTPPPGKIKIGGGGRGRLSWEDGGVGEWWMDGWNMESCISSKDFQKNNNFL